MPFPRKLLNDGEDVVLDLHPHWWFFAGPLVAVAIVLGLLVVVVGIYDVNVTPLSYALVVVLCINIVWLLLRYARWATTNFVVTTDRLIHRKGVLRKEGREIPLERINDISCAQSIFERIIRAGDVMIESGGERGQQHFTDIPAPFRVQNVIYAEIERAQARDADRMAGRRELSIPEQIDKLNDLRERGVISDAEFSAKKAQLLDRL